MSTEILSSDVHKILLSVLDSIDLARFHIDINYHSAVSIVIEKQNHNISYS